MKTFSADCLVCGKPIKYMFNAIRKKCAVCGMEEDTTVLCEDGHYICDKCHVGSSDEYISKFCLNSESLSPVLIASELMRSSLVKMHGPEHHYLITAALLTAYRNAGGKIDLENCLNLALQRSSKVPGGVCGMWGCCGAGVGTGIFVSIVTGATPLSKEEWSQANLMTSQSLKEISENGGPRCCKRNTYISIIRATEFTKEHLGIQMERPDNLTCTFFNLNSTCRKNDCLFYRNRTSK